MLFYRFRTLAPAAALAAGAALGALAPLLGAVGGSIGHAAHLALSAGWSFAALAFCVGLARKAKVESAVLAGVSLIAAVIAYYLTKLGQGAFDTADLNNPMGGTTHIYWQSFLSKTLMWCIPACIFGPILGLSGNLARNHGFRGLPFRLLIPVAAIVETSQRLRFEAALQGAIAETTWSGIRLLAVTSAIALIGWTLIVRQSSSSAAQARK